MSEEENYYIFNDTSEQINLSELANKMKDLEFKNKALEADNKQLKDRLENHQSKCFIQDVQLKNAEAENKELKARLDKYEPDWRLDGDFKEPKT